jgi:hypothetical protein
MKKIIYLVIALLFLNSSAFAADKAKVQVGSVSGVAKEGIVAVVQGDFINVGLAGVGKKGVATVTILLPSTFSTEKGSETDLFSLVGESDDDNPGEAALGFLGTKVVGRSGLGFAPADNTVVTGKLKVVFYDEETKELKFVLSATASPYTQVKTTLSGSETTTPTKNLVIKAQGIVTLP